MKKRICTIGVGRWGRNHVRTLAQLDLLGGFVETSESGLRELRKAYPDVEAFSSIDQAIDHGFDGFTVATPAATHFDIAQKLLSARLPVLVEKPISLRASEARELKRLADENDTALMVGHLLLFHPAIVKMKSLIDDGKIGKLQYLYSNRLNLGTVRTEENILWSFAPHDISIFQHFIGVPPEVVVSQGGAFLQPTIHDSTMTTFQYPDNISGHIFVSWLHPFKEHRLVVIGSKGMLSFEPTVDENEILFYEKGIDLIQGEPIKRDGATKAIALDRAEPLASELSYFAEHIEDRRIEIAGADNAIEVLDILERATESLLNHGATTPKSSDFEPEHKYFVHGSSYLDAGARVGAGTKIWHFSHVLSGAVIGENCVLGQNVSIGNDVKIGNSVKIQNNVSIYEGVELEDHVFCGPSMVFTNVLNPRSKYPQRGSEHYHRTLVCKGASLGANCTIVCGNTIGKHAFIAAGAVVTTDVPDYALMMGVPAQRKGWMCECGEGLTLENGRSECGRCKKEYKEDGVVLTLESG